MDAKIKKRKLGNAGPEVSALGMGCMNLSFGTGADRRRPAGDRRATIQNKSAGCKA